MACTVYKMPLGKSDQEECDTGDHVPLLSVTTSKVKQRLMTPLNEVRHRGSSGGGETQE